jgi:hypothetical protein
MRQELPVTEPEPDALSVAAKETAPGERLLWADRPGAARARRRVLPMLLFGLLFAGFALLWTIRASEAGGGAMALVGLPLVAVGIALAGAPWWRPRRARATVYAITDQRLMIIEGWPRSKVRSFGADDIEAIERRERADGTGDVVFRHEVHWRDDLRLRRDGPPNYRSRRRAIGFFGISEPRRIEAAVRALKDRRDPSGPGARPA